MFAIIKRKDLDHVLSLLNNSKYKTIRLSTELEKDGVLQFLDLSLKRQSDGTIKVSVYHKPTSTNRFITSDSYCPQSHKMAVFHSMVHRLCKLPLNVIDFMDELKYIRTIASVNGFNENIVDELVEKHSKKIKKQNLSTFFQNSQKSERKRFCVNYAAPLTNKLQKIFKNYKTDLVFASENKLKSLLLTTKDKIEDTAKSGIYEISCKECPKIYIGQSRRQVAIRGKEHKAHIKYNRPEKSAVAKHVLNDMHSGITKLELKIKKAVTKDYYLDAWESLYMHKNKEVLMNTDPAPISSPLFNF